MIFRFALLLSTRGIRYVSVHIALADNPSCLLYLLFTISYLERQASDEATKGIVNIIKYTARVFLASSHSEVTLSAIAIGRTEVIKQGHTVSNLYNTFRPLSVW
jgi:hypothetical protein